MNTKAQCPQVRHTDFFITEIDFIEATVAATALSLHSNMASTVLNRLLWALGTHSPKDRIEDLATMWVEVLDEDASAEAEEALQILIKRVMLGAQAYMDSELCGRAPHRP